MTTTMAPAQLRPGQRVRLSEHGRAHVHRSAVNRDGVVRSVLSDDLVTVVRDGTNQPICFSASFWEPVPEPPPEPVVVPTRESREPIDFLVLFQRPDPAAGRDWREDSPYLVPASPDGVHRVFHGPTGRVVAEYRQVGWAREHKAELNAAFWAARKVS